MVSRTTDSKGRVTLGEKFANRTVIVEEVDDTEVRVTLARIVPERELWLHENEAARASVARGIEQARQGQFTTKAPDLDADAELADQLEGDA